MRILYDNKIKTATIIPSSNVAVYPTYNLYSDHLSEWFKFTGIVSEWIKFTGGMTASYVAIMAHNFSSTAIVKLQANSSDSWTSPPFELTLTVENFIIDSFTEVTYDYWRITIEDLDNTESRLRIGGIFIGTHLQLPGMKIDQEITDNSNNDVSFSTGRQIYCDIGIDFKEFKINFPFISTAQRNSLRTLWNTVGNYTPIICLIWENALDLQAPIYCHLVKPISWKRTDIQNALWSTTLDLGEVF